MSTTFNASAFAELDKLTTPNLDGLEPDWEFHAADDELQEIAKYISKQTGHHDNLEPNRIKFYYTTKIQKDGGRFVLGSLAARPAYERMLFDKYDYMLFIYYPVWRNLDTKNKVIQLDKILCGIQLMPGKDMAELVVKKKATDSREYLDNLHHFGNEDVLKSSEIVDMAVKQLIMEAAEKKKLDKDLKKQNKKKKGDNE